MSTRNDVKSNRKWNEKQVYKVANEKAQFDDQNHKNQEEKEEEQQKAESWI